MKRQKWTAALISILVGSITFVFAEEKKDIPDHTNFQSCQPCHAEKQSMWEASGHSKAIALTADVVPAAADCKGCHAQKQQNKAAADAKKESFHKESCLACHSRQKTAYDHRIVADPEKLCESCHTQRPIFLGKGAKGMDDLRNFHSGVPCVSCHMTEGNHQMRVLRPDAPGLSDKRQDACTACHKDNNREARVRQIQEWQSTYDENMAPLLADVKAIEAALLKTPKRLNASLKSKFEDVKFNLSLMGKDGSRGFHNFVFSLEIAAQAKSSLKEIKAALK
jgi:predicted CXXCH cytochrome family protein